MSKLAVVNQQRNERPKGFNKFGMSCWNILPYEEFNDSESFCRIVYEAIHALMSERLIDYDDLYEAAEIAANHLEDEWWNMHRRLLVVNDFAFIIIRSTSCKGWKHYIGIAYVHDEDEPFNKPYNIKFVKELSKDYISNNNYEDLIYSQAPYEDINDIYNIEKPMITKFCIVNEYID